MADDIDPEVLKALQNAESSVQNPASSPATQNSLIGKLGTIDMSRRDDGGDITSGETIVQDMGGSDGEASQQNEQSGTQSGMGDIPLPILPDITAYDLDGTTILHTGNGSGVWPIGIDDDEPFNTTDVAWYKIAWCDNTDPDNPVSGTRFALLSEFVPD